jgi:chaperone modulatory protein CbpM
MIGKRELIDAFERLEADALQRWIDLDWVRPQLEADELRFDEVDIARVRLICDLHYELRIEESSLSVVLSLMDQLYAARRDLRRLAVAVKAQPDDVRAAISKLTVTAS